MENAENMQLNSTIVDNPLKGGNVPLEAESRLSTPSGTSLEVGCKKQNSSAIAAVENDQLLNQVASYANLQRALKTVIKNKGAPGVDKQSVDVVDNKQDVIIPELRTLLLTGKYLPGDVRRVWIPKPCGGKRGLSIPNVVDRIVQTAVLQVLEPIYEPTFHPSSHGFRHNKGASTAIVEVRKYIEEGYDVVVDLDIAKFFDCVNHQRLLNRLAQRIKDGKLLQLIHRMLKAKVVLPEGVHISVTEGVHQGGPLSPLLSNIVLDELDLELRRRGLRFCRFADDCNIYVRSERAGQRVMESIRRFIERRLRLKLNEEKSSVTRPDISHFLGFKFTRGDQGEVETQLSQRSLDRIKVRIRSLTPRVWGNSLNECINRLNTYLKGWMAYFGKCTKAAMKTFDALDAHIRRRLRMIIIRQKKRPRYLFRHLLKRGLKESLAAKTAFSKRGLWRKSISNGMHKAYPVAWFHMNGLVSLGRLLQGKLGSMVHCGEPARRL